MEDDDDDNKAGLIDVDIPTVAINHTHNGDSATAATPSADKLIEAAQADNCLAINQNSQSNRIYLQTM
jgi:hypothetical protein